MLWRCYTCTALYTNNGLLFLDEDSSDVTFCSNEMGILSVNLNNNNLDNNFYDDDSDTIILIRLLAWHSKLKSVKHLKNISEELMQIAWHPKRRSNFCMAEDEKKEIELIFTE